MAQTRAAISPFTSLFMLYIFVLPFYQLFLVTAYSFSLSLPSGLDANLLQVTAELWTRFRQRTYTSFISILNSVVPLSHVWPLRPMLSLPVLPVLSRFAFALFIFVNS